MILRASKLLTIPLPAGRLFVDLIHVKTLVFCRAKE